MSAYASADVCGPTRWAVSLAFMWIGARPRIALPSVLLAATALLAACGSSSSDSGAATPSTPAATLPATPGDGKVFYVSIGDSYAAGYQPTATGKEGTTSTAGFAYQLADKAKLGGKGLTLVNFACSGATTTSLVTEKGCGPGRLGPGAVNYPDQTQAAAAIAFVKQHAAQVGLVTISISGNDVTSCADAAPSEVASCISTALVKVKTNIGPMLTQLRQAAGPSTKIVGLTYPDVVLGKYVSGEAADKSLAALSVTAFRSLINPALKAEYATVNATFVDVTAATGAYTPFTQTTTQAPYGTVPVAVAKVCQLTWFCQFENIHPRADGYAVIADLVAKAIA